MTDKELALALDDSFTKETELIRKILISSGLERDIFVDELKAVKEKTNDLIMDYYNRPDYDSIELYESTLPTIKVLNEYKKLSTMKEFLKGDIIPSYIRDELVFNHDYNRSVELLNMFKWYIDNHDLSNDKKEYLVDALLSDKEVIAAARNELVGRSLGLMVSDDDINYADNKKTISTLMDMRNQSPLYKAMLDIIVDDHNGDFSGPLLYASMLISVNYKLAEQYGIDPEVLRISNTIDKGIDNIGRDPKYKKAVDGLKSIIDDSKALLNAYRMN